MAGILDFTGAAPRGGLLGGLNDNAILGYLAGALQGGNLGQSIGHGLQGFLTGAGLDQRQQALPATYGALAQSGLPEPLARAATLNPDLLKTIAPEYLGGFKVVQTGQDAFGRKTFKMQGPGGRLYDIPERATGGSTEATESGGSFAPGANRIDPELAGKEYLEQLSPEVQPAVKNGSSGYPAATPTSQNGSSGNPPAAPAPNQTKIQRWERGRDGVPRPVAR